MPDATRTGPGRSADAQHRPSASIRIRPHCETGRVASEPRGLDFADIAPIHRAFAPMVREQRFDVSEMAIATFLQAKAYGKPLRAAAGGVGCALPAIALCCAGRTATLRGPGDLAGAGWAYGPTVKRPAVWLRGILADMHGVRPEPCAGSPSRMRMSPSTAIRPGSSGRHPARTCWACFAQGELDAVIVGNDVPDDPTLRTVISRPQADAEAFWETHGFVPLNHLVAVRTEIAQRRPDVVLELVRMFRAAKAAEPGTSKRARYALDATALTGALQLVLRYAAEQHLLPRALSVAELWAELPATDDPRG